MLLFVVAVAFIFSAKAQQETYSAHYKTDLYMNLKNLQISKDSLDDNITEAILKEIQHQSIKVSTFEKYVTANKNYMMIKTVYPSYNQQTKKTVLDSTILKIDKRNHLLYNEKENKFYQLASSEVINKGNIIELIYNNKHSYSYKDPEIPNEIMPIFSNNLEENGGVTVFIGENVVSRLQNWEVNAENLDFSRLFENVSEGKSLASISMF
ncbi:hypothetical protein ACFSO9_03030 [Mesonia maritima]